MIYGHPPTKMYVYVGGDGGGGWCIRVGVCVHNVFKISVQNQMEIYGGCDFFYGCNTQKMKQKKMVKMVISHNSQVK